MPQHGYRALQSLLNPTLVVWRSTPSVGPIALERPCAARALQAHVLGKAARTLGAILIRRPPAAALSDLRRLPPLGDAAVTNEGRPGARAPARDAHCSPTRSFGGVLRGAARQAMFRWQRTLRPRGRPPASSKDHAGSADHSRCCPAASSSASADLLLNCRIGPALPRSASARGACLRSPKAKTMTCLGGGGFRRGAHRRVPLAFSDGDEATSPRRGMAVSAREDYNAARALARFWPSSPSVA